MTSSRKWGMRALALAMVLSLLMAPVSAIARGGHNNGDETQDQLEPVGELLVGDPDDGGGQRTRRPGEGEFPQSYLLAILRGLISGTRVPVFASGLREVGLRTTAELGRPRGGER